MWSAVWRVAGVQTYNSGSPMSISPGYSLRIPGAGNRSSVTSYEGWLATPKSGSFNPFSDVWWDTSVMNKTPSTTAPAGAKVWVSKEGFGNATQRNPKIRSPWYLARTSLWRARSTSPSVSAWTSDGKLLTCSTGTAGAAQAPR